MGVNPSAKRGGFIRIDDVFPLTYERTCSTRRCEERAYWGVFYAQITRYHCDPHLPPKLRTWLVENNRRTTPVTDDVYEDGSCGVCDHLEHGYPLDRCLDEDCACGIARVSLPAIPEWMRPHDDYTPLTDEQVAAIREDIEDTAPPVRRIHARRLLADREHYKRRAEAAERGRCHRCGGDKMLAMPCKNGCDDR